MNTQHIREHLKVAQMLAEKDGKLFLAQIIEVAIKATDAADINQPDGRRKSDAA
jgi:hypothetical protein